MRLLGQEKAKWMRWTAETTPRGGPARTPIDAEPPSHGA